MAEQWSTLKNNREVRILVIFKIDLCSPISFQRSRRELSIDVAVQRSILKNKVEERSLVIFQDRPMFTVQPYHSKGRGESFPLVSVNIGLS